MTAARPFQWISVRALIAFAVAVLVLWIAPLVLPLGDYTHNIIGLTFMFMAAALAWNWLGGFVGQISFGHSAMFGVGGFVAARLMLAFGLPTVVGWLAGGLVAGVYALLWGHPTLRLRGPYFSIATIGVGEATRLIATYWSDFTGGSSGLSLPLASGPTKYQLYWYGLYLLVAAVAISYWLRRSRIGLAGLPATIVHCGTSLVTTAPAPITLWSPMLIPSTTTAFEPIQTSSPIVMPLVLMGC